MKDTSLCSEIMWYLDVTEVSEEHSASIFRIQEYTKKPLRSCSLGLILNPKGGGTFLRNVRELLPNYTASHPRIYVIPEPYHAMKTYMRVEE
jgi:hypothetical protein